MLFSLLGNMLDSRHRAIWSVWANVTPYCFSGEQRCASIRGSHAVTCEHLTLTHKYAYATGAGGFWREKSQ